MELLTERKGRRSEPLSKDEHKALSKLYFSFPTKMDAAHYFEIKRQILDMVVLRGSGSPETISKVREKLVGL